MEQHKDQFATAGMQVVAISQAHPNHARRLCDQLAPSITCLCNGTVDDYNTYGISLGNMAQYAGLSTAPAYFRAIRAGYLGGRPDSNENKRLMPATFLIDTRGSIIHAHYNKIVGDNPDLNVLIDLIKTA